jgi:hypothetical protein
MSDLNRRLLKYRRKEPETITTGPGPMETPRHCLADGTLLESPRAYFINIWPDTRRFRFNTGRGYTPAGQIIDCYILHQERAYYPSQNSSEWHTEILFLDITRNISGVIRQHDFKFEDHSRLEFTAEPIMGLYDFGGYATPTKDQEKAAQVTTARPRGMPDGCMQTTMGRKPQVIKYHGT